MLRPSQRLLAHPPTLAWVVLAVSIAFNALSLATVGRSRFEKVARPVPRKQFSYIGDDHPRELPVQLDLVAMKFENSEHYRISEYFDTWTEWQVLTQNFPQDRPTVRLGPQGREFNISMFTALECIDTLRKALINGPDGHSGVCLNYMRQSVLCGSDTTLDAMDATDENSNLIGTDGVGSTHVCRDWSRVYEFVDDNQKGPLWETAEK